MGADYHAKGEFRLQPSVRISQAAPVQNTWYEVLAYTGVYTHIHGVGACVLVANETIEVEVTCDGVTSITALALTFGSIYMLRPAVFQITVQNSFELVAAGNMNLCLKGHNIRIRIRKTTALGAGNLQCKVVYSIV